LRTIDISITKKRNLKFFAYDLANFEEFNSHPSLLTNKEKEKNLPFKRGELERVDVTYYEVIKTLEKL
jgi:NAD-dependent DNA ligase